MHPFGLEIVLEPPHTLECEYTAHTLIMPTNTVTLASGHEMPLVGFGLWKVPADKAGDIVYNVSIGYKCPVLSWLTLI